MRVVAADYSVGEHGVYAYVRTRRVDSLGPTFGLTSAAFDTTEAAQEWIDNHIKRIEFGVER